MWNVKACLLLLSTKSCQNDRILLNTVFTPGSTNYEVLNIFFDSENAQLLQEGLYGSHDSTQRCFYVHLALVLLTSYIRVAISSLQLLDYFALFLSRGYYLEGEFLKRYELFPFFQHVHPRYEAYLQDELNGLLRSSGYKKDEESLFLKKFALNGRNAYNKFWLHQLSLLLGNRKQYVWLN